MISHSILLKSLGICRFFCKNFKFSLALGGFAPEPHYTQRNGLLACVLGADPPFMEKIKVAIGKFGGNSQTFGWGEFSFILIFWRNPRKKFIKFLQSDYLFNFAWAISIKFLKDFLLSGASTPRTHIIACPYHIPLFSLSSSRKLKIFRKNLHFSRIFSLIFQMFINFDAYFWKITPNFRVLPNSKISFRRSKIVPPNIWWTP